MNENNLIEFRENRLNEIIFMLVQIDEEENFYYVDHSDFGGMYFNILGKLVTNSQV